MDLGENGDLRALRYYLKVDIDLCAFSRIVLVAFTDFGGCAMLSLCTLCFYFVYVV